MADVKWEMVRGECTGGDGDYSYTFLYHILKDKVEVLSFGVGVYEKSEEEKPVAIVIDNNNPNCISVTVKSFYDKFSYLSQNGGKSWWKE